MRSESRSTHRAAMMADSSRKRPYGLLLLLALAAALVSVGLLHNLRGKRVSGLFHEQEQQLLVLQILLQKEREESNEVRNRLEDLKVKTISLINEKNELNDKLMEAETDVTNLRRMQKEMKEALQEKQNQINSVEEKSAESIATNLRVTVLAEQLKQREAEIEEMKQHVQPKESAPAEDSSLRSDSSLISTKEEENLQSRAEEKVAHDPSDEKSSTEVGIASEKEQHSTEGTWVQLSTEAEDDDSKSDTNVENNGEELNASDDNSQDKIEISEEGESSGRTEETDHESGTLQVPEEHEESPGRKQAIDETNVNGAARKEQEVTKDGEPERSEQKDGREDSEKNDQNMPRRKRVKKRKNKMRGRRQDAELRATSVVAGDEQKTTSPNAEYVTTTDALTTTDDGSGKSPPTDEKQHDEEVVETSKDGRERIQVEDGTEGRIRDADEQQEQEKDAASADEIPERFEETQIEGSILRETTASEVDDGAIKETATMSTTTSSERR